MIEGHYWFRMKVWGLGFTCLSLVTKESSRSIRTSAPKVHAERASDQQVFALKFPAL